MEQCSGELKTILLKFGMGKDLTTSEINVSLLYHFNYSGSS